MDKWLEIIIDTPSADLEAVSARLIANNVPGLAVEEEEEFRAFLEENRQYWDYVDDELLERMKGVSRVKLYVTDDEAGRKPPEACRQGRALRCPTLRPR